MISQAHLSQEAGNHYNIGIHFMNLPSHFSIHTLTQVYRCKMHQHVHFYATAKYSIQSLHQIWSVFVMPFEINKRTPISRPGQIYFKGKSKQIEVTLTPTSPDPTLCLTTCSVT